MTTYKGTEIVQVDPLQPDPATIERAATLLRAGELVAFPTETVYGLGADAYNADAAEKIFAAKGRPYSDPLIVHIAEEESLRSLTHNLPPLAYQLAHAFWPGPLTLVVPASTRVPRLITAGLSTMAIRMPRHPIALALIRAAGTPIAAPSANRFMHVSPTTAQHVQADLSGRIPLILDGGPSEVGVESTILDLCADPPVILRPGGISQEALRSVLPSVRLQTKQQKPQDSISEHEKAQKAPGQLSTHYAPNVPAYLFVGSVDCMREAMLTEAGKYQTQGQTVGLLLADEDIPLFQNCAAHIYSLGSTLEQIATRLFAGLRTLEESGVQVILCRSFDKQGIGLAIHDRLLKSTGGRVIQASDVVSDES